MNYELYLGRYQEREAIREGELVALSILRISRSSFGLCEKHEKETFSISTRDDLIEKTFSEYLLTGIQGIFCDERTS